MPWRGSPSTTTKQALARSATIRSVTSVEGSESSPDSKRSAFGSSVNSNVSGSSAMGASQHDRTPPTVRLKSDAAAADTPVHWHANGVRAIDSTPSAHDSSILSEEPDSNNGAQWDSTIGKAGLGKTGRVINKLVSDNDALKRDIQIERLRAEEAKQAAKLLEDKMERMMNEYEGRLLEANVTKTLLARKERQVETLTATVEAEKNKVVFALQREKSWRDELERVRSESTTQVEEATSYAQLMEGRYNAISSHWRDQGDEVKRAVSKMKGDIDTIVEERQSDDDKIQTLRDLCEQQDNNIKQLTQDKERIARLFDEYKQTQEKDLRDIKTNARRREEEQERLLHESREALAKLKWALNVKKNVKDAQ
ncbi:mother-specific HO expression [Purpureocillium takamizusanense]|uniref:Mother-specific HO expression n=1 Tax=Purpureocillium takamizusanense TaxID=2060973 RepID=A0A9Q8V6B4_9HYPO|nr:mother-specific HO expression [Purpureocillium takamizusanense]UNI14690.1 mother-specific HO expression [Purpureocillium takamizusanense]